MECLQMPSNNSRLYYGSCRNGHKWTHYCLSDLQTLWTFSSVECRSRSSKTCSEYTEYLGWKHCNSTKATLSVYSVESGYGRLWNMGKI